jgi:polar amino acid transport system substrate-binding protein
MAPAADLTAFTEEWPPYNYSEHGEVKGIATDILRASCREARLACEIHVVPWARAYALAGRTPNTLVYTTARNAGREKEFLWVGPLFPRATWVFGRSGKEAEFHDIPSLAHARIGVVRGEAAEQDLLNAGVPKSALRPDGSNSAVLRMLVGGWVDAMVDTEIGMAWNLQQQSIPAGEVVPLMKLSDGGAYYFALNRDSRPEIRDALQNALDKLQKNGTVATLKAAYSPAKK